MTRWIVPCVLALALGVTAAGCGGGVIPAVHSEPERLEAARRAMAKRDYNIAIELLKGYITANAGSKDVDEAVYRLGQSYLATRDFPAAALEFERLLRDYPESDSSGSASFRLGEALYGQARPPDFDQDFTLKALDQWHDYLQTYPGHWLNAEAERKIGVARMKLAKKLSATGRLYLKLHLPGPARVYFNRILDEYADTPYTGEARFGLAVASEMQGDRKAAIEEFRQVEALHPGPLARRAAYERERLERERRSG